MLESFTALLLLSALCSFINERYLRLEMTIGLMLLALIFSIILIGLSYFDINIRHSEFMNMVQAINFSQFVLQGVLCFLLFAGAQNLSLKRLQHYRWDIIALAFVATLVATAVIASFTYVVFNALGYPLAYIHALIFGAIIAPTDPIAAVSILKKIGLPRPLEVIIEGESQFNDGVAVVIFVSLLSIAVGESSPVAYDILWLFIKEVLGGISVGLLMAWLTHILILRCQSTTTQLLISLSAVTTGYAIAEKTGVSGPIASVILGLIFGGYTLPQELSKTTREHIQLFWKMVNQLLNAILFVLIGLIALQLQLSNWKIVIFMPAVIILVLLGRFISVYCAMTVLRLKHKYNLSSRLEIASLFTWAGLRGALAIALVLSLPEWDVKSTLVSMVYGVVVFSILIQGSSLKSLFSPNLLKRMIKEDY